MSYTTTLKDFGKAADILKIGLKLEKVKPDTLVGIGILEGLKKNNGLKPLLIKLKEMAKDNHSRPLLLKAMKEELLTEIENLKL